MNANRTNSPQEIRPDGAVPKYGRAALFLSLTLVGCLAAILIIKPRVGPWLELRSANQDLTSPDNDTRVDAIRRLRRLGEDTDGRLLKLLHHPDKDVRNFAASTLSSKPTDNRIAAFLDSLENNQHAFEIGRHAPRLFCRHGKAASGPLTDVDRRMIAWLRPRLSLNVAETSGAAAWALTAFVGRDPRLRKPLVTYLEDADPDYEYIVLREMAAADPTLRDRYITLLLSGLGSKNSGDQKNASYGLETFRDPDDLRSRLQSRRATAEDSEEIVLIERALKRVGKYVVQ